MLSAKRDVSTAKRFFKKLMRAEHRRLPFSIGIDKNSAYPAASAHRNGLKRYCLRRPIERAMRRHGIDTSKAPQPQAA
jgi:transposase-like protein